MTEVPEMFFWNLLQLICSTMYILLLDLVWQSQIKIVLSRENV